MKSTNDTNYVAVCSLVQDLSGIANTEVQKGELAEGGGCRKHEKE